MNILNLCFLEILIFFFFLKVTFYYCFLQEIFLENENNVYDDYDDGDDNFFLNDILNIYIQNLVLEYIYNIDEKVECYYLSLPHFLTF